MKEEEKDNLFITFQQTIDSIITDKKRNPKNDKMLKKFNAKVNLGLQIDEEDYLWLNLLAEDGNYSLNRGLLEDFDLVLKASPEDLLFFSNGENSIMNMMMKKNEFGKRKLRFSKSSEGKRNIGILLKLSKILVLD